MDVYILDDLLRRSEVIDKYESLIWTDRWQAAGDFELRVLSTVQNRQRLRATVKLAMVESSRVMEIEYVETATDDEGRDILIVTGNDLIYGLEGRVARNTFASLGESPIWTLTGTPRAVITQIFDEVCRASSIFPEDHIPFLQAGTLTPPGNIEESTEEITVELGTEYLYSVIQSLCESYDFGFRLIRNADQSELYFEIYSGNDRTSAQAVLPPVVFSPSLENLSNIRHIQTIAGFKNVAYVYHPYVNRVVSLLGDASEITGFDRRVLRVDATSMEIPERPYVFTEGEDAAINEFARHDNMPEEYEEILRRVSSREYVSETDVAEVFVPLSEGLIIPLSDPIFETHFVELENALALALSYNETELTIVGALLEQLGKEELMRSRSLEALDGELSNYSNYKHDVDYQLGDLVDMRNADGVTNRMRVGEQIFISDSEGQKRYPTLTLSQFIAPGTWLGWDFNDTWTTVDGVWGDA